MGCLMTLQHMHATLVLYACSMTEACAGICSAAAANDNGQVAGQSWPSAAARAEQSLWPQQAFCITERIAEVKIPLLCISNVHKPGTGQTGEQKSRAR